MYEITDAERSSWPLSQRFSAYVVDPRVATRLFESRGWDLRTGEQPTKVFGRARIAATFVFAELDHYLAESERVTTGPVEFFGLGGATRNPR